MNNPISDSARRGQRSVATTEQLFLDPVTITFNIWSGSLYTLIHILLPQH